MKKTIIFMLFLAGLSACSQQHQQQQVRSRDYFVTDQNPYAGQPGVPQRLEQHEFRNQVRQRNGVVPSEYPNSYEDRAVRSSMNIMQTFSRAVAGGN